MKVNDEYVLHSSNGMDYKIIIVNINDYRESSMKYALDVWDENGVSCGEDVYFVGDDFFDKNNIEKVR